ncbi:MAG TPA: hypothetical protein VJ548_03845 [Azospira sp.]|nr:hypothetical protein [Betaproteobacteria bacterium]HJW02390.1 hypothetical protein [Azospira sp.]
MSSTFTDAAGKDLPERRGNTRLRSVFDAVYVQIEPFFDPKNTWGGRSLEHLAFRVVRDSHPELSQQEVHQIVVAASRVFRSKNPELAGKVPSPEEVKRSLLG